MPWSAVLSSGEIVAIHAIVVPTFDGDGEILLFGGDNHFRPPTGPIGPPFHTARFNCRTPTQALISVVSPDADLFCCGHAWNGDGRLLVAGGTQSFPEDTPPPHGDHDPPHFGGHRRAFMYNPAMMAFNEVASMGFAPGTTFGGGRWYPTLCTLATGEVLAVGGHPSGDDPRHNNNRPERYRSLVDRWFMGPATGSNDDPDLYPRLHVLRDGTVFVSSKMQGNPRCIAINPWTGKKRDVVNLPVPADEYQKFSSPSVLLPLTPRDGYRPRVLLCGGVTSQTVDLGDASPRWEMVPRNGSTATSLRRDACATILPTGNVLMTGGVRQNGAPVREPELYSTPLEHTPAAAAAGIGTPSYLPGGRGRWTTIAEPATVVRNYHSTALLMPDGRVWTGGGNAPGQPTFPPGPDQKQIEIFQPSYPPGNRPTITSCPRVVAYGHDFLVESAQAQDIRSVTLLRCGSSTHAFDTDQRCIFLSFIQETANRLRVTAPPDGAVAPPGHYMLFLVDRTGRPCEYATFIRVGGRACLPMDLVTDTLDKVVLSDSSDAGPALASHGGRLFLAWRGSGNPQLNLLFSDDGGATFRGKRVFSDTSPRDPALVSHGGRLFLGWTGEGGGGLNLAKVRLSGVGGGFGIEGLEDKVVLSDSSDAGPALASHCGRLFLAWRGSGNPQLNLLFSDDGGATFRGKRVFSDTSPHGQTLASHGAFLCLGWTGEGDGKLNVAKVALSTEIGLLTEILWPRQVISAVGPFAENAPNLLGAPDGTAYVLFPGLEEPGMPGMRATVGQFRGRHYPHLLELIGAGKVLPDGDFLSREDLKRADVVAFERNGTHPATGGGWEGCDWTFTDGTTTISVSWDGAAGAPRDAHVVANGSIRGSQYKHYFEVTRGDPISDPEVISFLLFSLPQLRTEDPGFTVEVKPRFSGGSDDTPDIDAIGLLPRGE
jgi:hypothetical protein